MRLTLDVIGDAEQIVGPNKERIVVLRGLKIAAIENLGATGDMFDTIDLCDNNIMRLDNLPPLNRLECLLLANNRLTKIDSDALLNIPRLKSIVLSNNRIHSVADLVPLTKGKCLERLVLWGNPVTSNPNYFSYLVHRIPTIRYIDFVKVNDARRAAAKKLFSGASGASLLSQIESMVTSQQDLKDEELSPPSAPDNNTNMDDDHTSSKSTDNNIRPAAPPEIPPRQQQLTPEQVITLKAKINDSTSIHEIEKLEEALRSGVMPTDDTDHDDAEMK